MVPHPLDIEFKAYAKINLHLEVLNRRPDGYHNIFSLMSSINLFDLLKLEYCGISSAPYRDVAMRLAASGGKNEDVMDAIPLEDNLVTKATRAYFRAIDRSAEVSISIEKNIPAGAGMGGGSSDAAAVLRMLNGLYAGLEENELLRVGATVGADVPFCLIGGAAICEGMGDILEKLDGGFNRCALVAYSGVHVDTGEAYRSLERGSKALQSSKQLGEKRRIFRAAAKACAFEMAAPLLKNDFEEPVFRRNPELRLTKQRMLEAGADFAIMTGSGSAIVGVFKDSNEACRAKQSLEGMMGQLYVADFF